VGPVLRSTTSKLSRTTSRNSPLLPAHHDCNLDFASTIWAVDSASIRGSRFKSVCSPGDVRSLGFWPEIQVPALSHESPASLRGKVIPEIQLPALFQRKSSQSSGSSYCLRSQLSLGDRATLSSDSADGLASDESTRAIPEYLSIQCLVPA
jgi:hypothetical protein